MVCLDAKKAFDLVEWVFFFKLLEHFNFGKYLIGYIKK